jgi:hypothetical protein
MKLRFSIVVAVLLAAIVAAAQDVRTDYDHSYDFSKIHTFAVKIGTAWGNPLNEERARSVTAQQLTAKGWKQTDEEQADALVVIHGARETRQSFDSMYSGASWSGYGWEGWGTPDTHATTGSREIRVGTIVVDIFDAKTKKLIFRGMGEDEISDQPEQNRKKIDAGGEKMFRNFPPK